MTEYMAMSVGQRLDYRNVDQVVRGRDMMLLDWDQSGFILIIAMTDMADQESEIIRHNKMLVSAFTDHKNVLPLWRFADSEIYGETPFDPTMYRPYVPGSREAILRTHIVTMVGVDSNTMIIRALRAVSLPAYFNRAIQEAWQDAWDNPFYSQQYAQWVDAMKVCYTLQEMFDRAEHMGS
ncbi:MAG: hypothetical protein VB144_11330 [Clostridia bacterium]|nr:hypothetical protein [Clostridia bacterium]